MSKLFSLRPLLLVAGAVGVASLMAAAPAQASQHLTVQSQAQHFFYCLSLMTSPDHAKLCGPGHEFIGMQYHSNGAPLVPTVKAPCTPPPHCKPPHCRPPCPPPCCHPHCKPPCERVTE